MNRRTILAAVAAIGIAASVLAAEPDEKKPEGPRPSPEIEKLGYFLGAWTIEATVKPIGAAQGGAMEGREMCRWMPGKFFVGCMIETKSPMGAKQIQGILGYDAEKKVYKWWSFDNQGHAETATGTLKDDTWTWSGDSMVGGKQLKTRETMSGATPDGYALRWETSPDGKTWTPVITGKVAKMTMPQRPGVTPGARPSPPAPPDKKN